MSNESDKNKPTDLAASLSRMDALQNLVSKGNQESQTEFAATVANYLSKAKATLTNPQVAKALSVFKTGQVHHIPPRYNVAAEISVFSQSLGEYMRSWTHIGLTYVNGTVKLGFVIDSAVYGSNQNDPTKFNLDYLRSASPSEITQFQNLKNKFLTEREKLILTLGGKWESFPKWSDSNYPPSLFQELTPQFFIQHPEFFPPFVEAVDETIDKATKILNPQGTALKEVLRQNIVSAEQAAQQGTLTQADIIRIAQEAARSEVLTDPVIQGAIRQGVSEQQVKEIVTVVVEEKLANMQIRIDNRFLGIDRRIDGITLNEIRLQKQIQQLAGNDKKAQAELHELAKGYKNPERVFKAALDIAAGFIPGAQGVVAILQAINDLFGPPDIH